MLGSGFFMLTLFDVCGIIKIMVIFDLPYDLCFFGKIQIPERKLAFF